MPEKEPKPEEKKKKKGVYETFNEIMARLTELAQKLKEDLKEEVKKSALEEQGQLRNKRDSLIDEFLKTPEGQQVEEKKEENKTRLDQAFTELEQASKEDYEEKKKTFTSLEQELAAEMSAYRDSDKVNEKHKKIATYELSKAIFEARSKRDQFLREQGQVVDLDRAAIEAKRVKTEAERKQLAVKLAQAASQQEKQLLKTFSEGKLDPKAVAELAKLQQVHRSLAMEGGSPYELTKEQIRTINSGDVEGTNLVFEQILSRFGLDRNRHFREADLTAQSQWINFMVMLRDKPDILEKYILRFGFEEGTHNLDLFLRGHAHPDKLPELLTNFQSPMLDVAVRQRGAAAAFRAYEQAFNYLFLTEGSLPPSKFFDPDKEDSWLNSWTREQVKNTLIADIAQREGFDLKKAEAEYEKTIAPFETTFMRTGYKVFIFSLRGDEIQASTISPRQTITAPWHEDMWRRLDPPGMPIKYWMEKYGPKEFFGAKDQATATSFYYFLSGGVEKNFRNIDEYKKAIKELEKSGEAQLNLFNIGGILSKSDWRANEAVAHIPDSLTRFMGVEMEVKALTAHGRADSETLIDAREIALAHARIRNPFALFRLASEADKEAILKASGVDPDKKKVFFELIYDDLSQALQQLVYQQQKEIKEKVLKEGLSETEKKAAAEKFLRENENKGLDFSFVTDAEKKNSLENFVTAIQSHFGPNSEELKKLAEKKVPFSLGTEDVPLELMRFTETGDVGLQRRFRDIGASARAVAAFWKLSGGLGQILQKEESILEAVKEIQGAVEEYGGSVSSNVALTLTDRIIEMVSEDNLQNFLPWPLNIIREKYFPTCKADNLFGLYHSSMGSEEIRMLVEKLIGLGCFPTMKPKEVRKLLFRKHKVTRLHILGEKLYAYSPLVAVALPAAALLWIGQQLKEDIEEAAKEV